MGIFCATVGEDALTTKESWIAAALGALEDSEVRAQKIDRCDAAQALFPGSMEVSEGHQHVQNSIGWHHQAQRTVEAICHGPCLLWQVGEGPEERMELADMFADKAFSHCLSAASSWEREPKEGDLCRALLSEDGEWHSAVVKAVETFTVTFVEYGKDQVVAKGEISLLQDNDDSDGEGSSDEGTCEMCKRAMPLTRHHLLPRRTHAKLKKKGFSKEKLLSSSYICRLRNPCQPPCARDQLCQHATTIPVNASWKRRSFVFAAAARPRCSRCPPEIADDSHRTHAPAGHATTWSMMPRTK